MKKLVLVLATLAHPLAGFAAGVDLTWNDCVGTGTEAYNKTFTCTGTVNESYDLVVQFRSPVTLGAAAAITAIIDVQTDQGYVPLAPFWRYDRNGCQRPSVGVQGVEMFDNIRLLPGCAGHDLDLWGGDGTAGSDGIGAYGADFPIDGLGRFVLLDARTLGIPLAGGANYYAFHLRFNNRHRSDCPGCEQKLFLLLNRLTIESVDGAPALDIRSPDRKSNSVTINCPAARAMALSAEPNPVQSGDLVKLTATVTPDSATGTVNFYDGGSPIGTAPVAGGSASLATRFETGYHTLMASYNGDSCFLGVSPTRALSVVEGVRSLVGN